MGACIRSAYNLEQVKTVSDMEFIITSDLEFYKEMLNSAKQDKLEIDEVKKQNKIEFLQEVIDEFEKLIKVVINYRKKDEESLTKINNIKKEYQISLYAIDKINRDEFCLHIEQIHKYLRGEM
jgi:hypothetical protein